MMRAKREYTKLINQRTEVIDGSDVVCLAFQPLPDGFMHTRRIRFVSPPTSWERRDYRVYPTLVSNYRIDNYCYIISPND